MKLQQMVGAAEWSVLSISERTPEGKCRECSYSFKETGYKCALVETSRTKLPPQGTWGRSLDKSCTETR